MKIREIITEDNDVEMDSNISLVTVLNFLKSRADEKGLTGKIKTQSLINLVRNTGSPFNYAALVAANENDPSVKNLIKSFNKVDVELQSEDPEVKNDTVNDTSAVQGGGTGNRSPQSTVSSMAKSALSKRQ